MRGIHIKSMFSTKKRIAAVALSGAVILGAGGIAAAFFTSTGNGTGSVTVGSATAWTVGESGSPTGGPLFPDHAIGGANIQTDGYTVTNGGHGSQSLTSVQISVANSDGSAWSSQTNGSDPACTAADFSVGGSATGSTHTDTHLAGDYTAGQTNSTGSVTVELIDNGLNQDNCEGLAVPLYFYAS